MGRTDDAIARLKIAIDLNRHSPDGRQLDRKTAPFHRQRQAKAFAALLAQNPAAYRPDLAQTLNNLGVLYDDTHRFADAEAALKEAAGIRRALAAQNPAAYRPDLAETLDSLGALYDDTHRFADAEAAYKEAADIRRALAAQNPGGRDISTATNRVDGWGARLGAGNLPTCS